MTSNYKTDNRNEFLDLTLPIFHVSHMIVIWKKMPISRWRFAAILDLWLKKLLYHKITYWNGFLTPKITQIQPITHIWENNHKKVTKSLFDMLISIIYANYQKLCIETECLFG